MFPTGDSSSVGANGFRAKETRTKLEGQTLADHPTGAGPRSLLRV